MDERKVVENGKVWLRKVVSPYRGSIAFLTVCSVLTTLLSLAFAYLVKYLIDSASNGRPDSLALFATIVLGILLLRVALQTWSNYQSEKISSKMFVTLRGNVYAKILRSDYASVQQYHSGELMQRLTSDVQEVVVDSVGLPPAVVGMFVQCVGAIVALLTINPLFTAVYVVCGCVFGGITALFRKQVKKSHQAVLEADGVMRSFMQESVSSLLTVKSYGAELKMSSKADEYGKTYFDRRMKRNFLRSAMNAVYSLLSNFGLIFAVVWCSVTVLQGNTEYGSILSVILLLMQLQHPFSAFSSVIPAYYARQASGERLQKIDEFPVENCVAEETDEDRRKMQALFVEDLTFHYGRESVLENVDFTIEKGDIVCLTGASGSGKSTLFKLLLCVYTPLRGGIYVEYDRGEKRLLTAQSRRLFAYVPQGNFLFSGTIYENLTFFNEDKDLALLDEKVAAALHAACADFVFDLPQGLQTQLGEKGVGLSEGQMQRLAIARAILSDRPVLLLDEATSALDGRTEREVLQNVKRLTGKTCLIVTHRPAALEIADRVLTVENGKVTQR